MHLFRFGLVLERFATGTAWVLSAWGSSRLCAVIRPEQPPHTSKARRFEHDRVAPSHFRTGWMAIATIAAGAGAAVLATRLFAAAASAWGPSGSSAAPMSSRSILPACWRGYAAV
jgi:hypothetical protein